MPSIYERSPSQHFRTLNSDDSSLEVKTFKRRTTASGNSKDDKGAVSICPTTFKDALDGFSESAKVGIDVLSELAEIHPFIYAPVMAFKLVVTLDLKRRENNMKVLAVNVEMQSMMTVLLQLKNIKDPESFHPNTGLEGLMTEIAEYIKESASLCDWYTKKSTIRKYLKSFIYEARLAECANGFAEYGEKLQRALSIHAVHNIDSANKKLDRQGAQIDDIQQQMRELFIRLDSPREKKIRDLIVASGGAKATIEDPKSLQMLINRSGENSSGVNGRTDVGLRKLRKSLLGELSEDVDEALERNMALFEGKLIIQMREIDLAIAKQGDRIIAFFSGGHERILDPHIREIWREMGWKSTVKARHFVLALRDYYLGPPHIAHHSSDNGLHPQQLLSPPITTDIASSEKQGYFDSPSSQDESWATAYVNVSCLQAIAEAIDDDGSGFVNVREVNAFTALRPNGWSVFQWLAYWAAGWQSSISIYTEKIYRLMLKIYNLRERIPQDNLVILDAYLDDWSFYRLELLLRSTVNPTIPIVSELAKLRDEFCATEEQRLRKNLEAIGYNIDSPSTVSLVTGPGRIERYIYPLIYLLLQNHVKTIQLACLHTLHVDELQEKYESVGCIFSVFDARFQELSAIFKQMHIDPETHFKNYAFGMFSASCPDSAWDLEGYKLSDVWDELPHESDEDAEIDTPVDFPLTILKYGVQNPLELSSLPIYSSDLDDHPDDIVGTWAGFCHKELLGNTVPHEGLLRITFESDSSGAGSGIVVTFRGPMELKYVLSTSADKVQQDIDFVMAYSDGYWMRCSGTIDRSTALITGTWYSCETDKEPQPIPSIDGTIHDYSTTTSSMATVSELEGCLSDSDSFVTVSNFDSSTESSRSTGTFALSRTPAPLVKYRYTPAAFSASRSRARWSFACDAILHTVRQRSLAKPFVLSRLRDARSFVELSIKNFIWQNDDTERSEFTDREIVALAEIQGNICPSIDQFYHSVACYLFERLPFHSGRTCGGQFCADTDDGKAILQSRYMCIVCIDQTLTDTLDLCIKCKDTEDTEEWPSHNLSHSLLRSHYFLQDCDRAWMIDAARKMSERIKNAFQTKGSSSLAKIQGTRDGEVGDGNEDQSSDDATMICTLCQKKLELPCWVCIKCEPDRLVCSECDEEHQTLPPPEKMITASVPKLQSMHALHPMLWIRDDQDVDIPDNDQLTRVEDRLSVVEDLVEESLGALKDEVFDRLTAIEGRLDGHLQSIDTKIGSVGEGFERRLSHLEARFDSLEVLLRDFLARSRHV